jgi:putative zinc finger/helix-turn-helix YgiT family protein
MSATTFCPECMQMTEFYVVDRTETLPVKGEDVTVPAKVAVCRQCGLDIGDERYDNATFISAYAVYRARHGLLQPDEIRGIRSMYGLGQKAFARLLGWGDVTVHRYETGSLQSEGHDELLRMAQDPANARRLLDRRGGRLTPDQRTTVERRLSEFSVEHEGLVVREEQAAYAACPSVRKLGEMIVYFAGRPKTWRTKLNKLLFYADFLHYRRHGLAISGCRYVHMQFGPVPADFYTLQATLVEDTSLSEQHVEHGDCESTVFSASRPADLSVFTEEELETLREVAAHFEGWTAKRISEFSHAEPGWVRTRDRETIPYEYAEKLQLA